jgi:hypothetical protein
MEHTFTPERRLEIYKEAQRVCEGIDYVDGLCIILGEVAYGCFRWGPWTFWNQAKTHFPELRHWDLSYEGFTPTQRREILESAINEVTELIKSTSCPTSSTP